ncbi:hypothetical protein EGT36_01150 [Agrobacterium sp. FDAARGOS_525]|nr:hypothetical protein DOU54_27000 [Agrobacterium sp. MS2]RSC41560.1 hypothetical protein EGT36_01150 [Agrobacterium sp. FDAARGOS_525]
MTLIWRGGDDSRSRETIESGAISTDRVPEVHRGLECLRTMDRIIDWYHRRRPETPVMPADLVALLAALPNNRPICIRVGMTYFVLTASTVAIDEQEGLLLEPPVLGA